MIKRLRRIVSCGNTLRTVLISLALTSLTVNAAAQPSSEQNVRKFKIGLSVGLTGGSATYAADVRDAVLFANEELGGSRFELIIEDDKCSSKEAVAIAQKFVNIDHVDAVIGSVCSGAAVAAAPIFERAKIIQMLPNAAASNATSAGEYTFAANPGNGPVARILFDYLAANHKKVGLMTEQVEMSVDLHNKLLEYSKDSALRFVTEDFLVDDHDFSAILLKLRQQNLDALVINPQGDPRAAEVLKKVRETKWDVPVYSVYWGASETFLNLAGPLAEGFIFADRASAEEMANAEGKMLFQRFVERYGSPRSSTNIFVFSFESFRAISDALTNSADPRSYLLNTTFKGIFGDYTFKSNRRLLELPVVLRKIENGRRVLIKINRN